MVASHRVQLGILSFGASGEAVVIGGIFEIPVIFFNRGSISEIVEIALEEFDMIFEELLMIGY